MTNVSMAQALSGTDWYMESFGLTVSYSLYGDLLGTSTWARREQEKCIKSGFCKPTEEVVEAKAFPVKEAKSTEPESPAPEEEMNDEAAAPTEDELNFNDEEAAEEGDPDEEF